MNRRDFLRTAGAAAVATAAAGLPVGAEVKIPEEYKTGGFFIGCQAWTWNNFTAMEAIEKTAQAGGRVIEFFPGQAFAKDMPGVKWDHNATPDQIAKINEQLAKYKIKAVNYGVVGIPKDEAQAAKIFSWAKTMGIRAVTTESVDAIDTIEKMVKEYDVMCGFHDHPKQPNNPNYRMWDPNYILEVVKSRDKRVGACADTGHWVRSGLKPVDAIRILKGRVISSHLKDLNVFAPNGHDVPAGTGVSDVPGILEELRKQGFDGNISIEYEHNMAASMPEVAQSIGYLRGFLQAKKW